MKRFRTSIFPSLLLLLPLLLASCASKRVAEKEDLSEKPDTSVAVMPLESEKPTFAVEDTTTIEAFPEPDYEGVPIVERLELLLDDTIFARTQVALLVYDLDDDRVLFECNPRQCMRPASCQKIVTAVAALHHLGVNYRYRTSLYTAGTVTDSLLEGDLYVRGGFDPLFGKDDLRAFVDSIQAWGINSVTGNLCLDLSFKDKDRLGWGWCWDDDEVPLTPLLYIGADNFAESFLQLLRQRGIRLQGRTVETLLPDSAKKLCTRSHTIDQVLQPMLKKSDNNAAESLFFQLAAADGKPFADRKDAEKKINSLIRSLNLQPSHYQIADGSGLSLYNYLTPQLLVKILRFAYKDQTIFRHLYPALPVAGRDGTLKKRMRATTAADNVHAKTGTVEGISTLAGYCTAANGHTLCFAIMNQGIRHASTGRNFQDRVCVALTK